MFVVAVVVLVLVLVMVMVLLVLLVLVFAGIGVVGISVGVVGVGGDAAGVGGGGGCVVVVVVVFVACIPGILFEQLDPRPAVFLMKRCYNSIYPPMYHVPSITPFCPLYPVLFVRFIVFLTLILGRISFQYDGRGVSVLRRRWTK